MAACIILTENLKRIASLLGIPEDRVLRLAGLSSKAEGWTLKDIELELKRQEDSIRKGKVLYVTRELMPDERLASSSSDGSIKVLKDISIDEFFSYIRGEKESVTSKQKAEVYKALAKARDLDIEEFDRRMHNLITSYSDIVWFLYFHELSHLLDNDNASYWTETLEERDSGNIDWLAPNKISIETKATEEAITRLKYKKEVASLSEEQKELFSNLFNPYSEGGGADINDLFTVPLPGEIDKAIAAFSWEGKIPFKREINWIVQHLKPEYQPHLSSFYNKMILRDKVVIQKIKRSDTAEEETGEVNKTNEASITKEVPFTIPVILRNFLAVSSTEENPLVKFNHTFNSILRANAIEALATSFNRLIKSNVPQGVEVKEWIKANIPFLLENLKQELEEYRVNKALQERDTKRFGEDFVTLKLEYIEKILDSENLLILLKDVSIPLEREYGIAIDFLKQTASDEVDLENSEEEDYRESDNYKGNEGYMIKAREVDPRSTVSSRVKLVLSQTPKGNGEVDVFGRPRMISFEYAHAVLMNELSKMAYVEDFIKTGDGNIVLTTLNNLVAKYPWISSIIRKIEHDPSLASQFYTDFRKDFILYTEVMDILEEREEDLVYDNGLKILNEKGEPIKGPVTITKRVTKYLNQAVAAESTMNSIVANYENSELLTDHSIYDKGSILEDLRVYNLERLAAISNTISLPEFNWNNQEDRDNAFSDLVEVLKSIGVNVLKGDLDALYKSPLFLNEKEALLSNIAVILESKIPKDANLIEHFNGAYTNIATIIGSVSELMNVTSARTGSKTYQSYSAPNYINTLVKRLTDINTDRRNKYILELFKKYKWFYNPEEDKWRNYWLELLESNAFVRDHMSIANMATILKLDEDGNAELLEYGDWTTPDIIRDFLILYYSIPKNKSNILFAKYAVPIYSDSPVANFITMPKFTGDTFKELILDKLVDVAELEIERIKDVKLRQDLLKQGKLSADLIIDYYDDLNKGGVFRFFPALNNTDVYQRVNDLYLKGDRSEARRVLAEAIRGIMEEGAAYYRASEVDFKDTLIQTGLDVNDDNLKDYLDEYYWNQAFATTLIILLTTTDLAYYKNLVDFQKRYKEVYAAGNKLNTNSTYGRKTEKVVYLKDEVLKSNVLNDIESVLKQAVSEGRISKLDAKAIKSKFEKVNVADALAYRCIDSMRAVLDMMGLWDDKMESAVNKFNNNEWTTADFSTIWQTIKPFMFTLIEDTTKGHFSSRKVPHQHKNSEFLLLAMHSLVVGSAMNKSPLLSTLNKWMLDNLIDVVMFESAAKIGGLGKITLSDNMSQEEITLSLELALDSDTAVKEFDYEDYMILQPTPEHLIDLIGIFGSQFRNLIYSDLSEDATFNLPGIDKALSKQELLSLYQQAIVENLLEDYERIKGRFTSIEDLLRALLESVKDNPKYGSDIVEALLIVDGKFNIPLYNPSTTEKIQEIVNSFFKNTITKLKIKGGNSILVSDFGFVDDLHCVYSTDKNGKKYLKEVECYLPAYSKQFYEAFVTVDKETGIEYLDYSRMEKECPELLEGIGYRIPTEGKYSMVPLKIKGFLPLANGSSIMLPADITVHAGSDFDKH